MEKGIKVFLCGYLILLLCSTVIFRVPMPERGFELKPFWSYTAICNGVDSMIPETIMNVVVFIPVGFMMGLVFSGINWRRVILAGVGISFSIELLQLLFRKGCFETDDVIHNTMGRLIGYGIYAIIRYLTNRVFYFIQ